MTPSLNDRPTWREEVACFLAYLEREPAAGTDPSVEERVPGLKAGRASIHDLSTGPLIAGVSAEEVRP